MLSELFGRPVNCQMQQWRKTAKKKFRPSGELPINKEHIRTYMMCLCTPLLVQVMQPGRGVRGMLVHRRDVNTAGLVTVGGEISQSYIIVAAFCGSRALFHVG